MSDTQAYGRLREHAVFVLLASTLFLAKMSIAAGNGIVSHKGDLLVAGGCWSPRSLSYEGIRCQAEIDRMYFSSQIPFPFLGRLRTLFLEESRALQVDTGNELFALGVTDRPIPSMC